ncbi:hypothetical protein L598_002700000120 [Mesorhizobium sp. J18]|nr:hypothetical protein L598_002700000120 [Mesorhizobium sp. J18]
MDGRVGKLRHLSDLGIPRCSEGVMVGFDPVGLAHHLDRDIVRLHRPNQPNAAFDLAIVEHDAGCRDLDGCAPGSLVDQELRAGIAEMVQGGCERHRMVALALRDGEELRLCAGSRMRVDGLAMGDGEPLRPQCLQSDIIGAAGDCPFDLRIQQLLEGGEEDALKLDGECQESVEEGGDRGQLVLDAIGIHQLQAGGGLKAVERAALDLAAHQQQIELA